MRRGRLAAAILALTAAALITLPARAQEDEDIRLKVTDVPIEGNEAFSDGRLHDLMINHPSGFWFLGRNWYEPDELEDDLEAIEMYHRLEGYMWARVVRHEVLPDTSERKVRIRIQLAEGPRTSVQEVDIMGNTAFSDSLLREEYITMEAGQPYRQALIRESQLALLNLYADHGYLEAVVDPTVRVDSARHLAMVDFLVTEGPQFIIDEIRIEGLQKTEPFVVRRELSFESGEIVNYSELAKSQRRLYQTTLFNSAFIRPVPAADGDPNHKDIVVDLREVRSIQLEVAAGYGTEDRVRGRTEVQHRNLFGTGRRVGLEAKASFIERSGQAYYVQPWTFGIPWESNLIASLEYREEPGFDIYRQTGKYIFSRKFTRHSSLALTYRLERADLRYVTVADFPSDLENNISSLNLAGIWDTRDDLFNATRGVYLQVSAEYAGGFLGGTTDFVRPIGGYKYYRTLRRGTVVATAGQVGWVDYFGSSDDVPLSERFFLGGANDLRGFGYRLVGPLDVAGTPVGGNFLISTNLAEIRQHVWSMFGVVGFVDVGAIWPRVADVRLRDLRIGAGPGLRANTPIGIVRLDWGVNVGPRDGEDPWQIYFSIGQAF
ncbi:MAG: outer membrane protein assembly factor BamA [Candidatus Zixiibacteriota bacterium]|nr:MAG: outer membrane protein assembly factor BamA [candidate division Zixibacteria bacterium]